MKKILYILIGLLLFGGTALAALQVTPTYPAAYWVKGPLNADASGLPADLSGYKVVFYKNSNNAPAAYAFALSDENGNFRINGLDDVRMTPLTAETCYIGVVGKAGYGLNETLITLEAADLANGYKMTSLTLAAGEGIPDPTSAIQIISPAGGENWQIATTQNISWEAPAGITSFKLEYSADGGATYSTIMASVNAKNYSWFVTPPMSTNAKIRVSDALNSATSAESNPFNVGIPPRRGGPTLEVTTLLDGYYCETGEAAGTQTFTSIEVELRDPDTGATVTAEPFYLIYDNGTDKYVKAIDGVGENIVDGSSYKLVIKHPTHLPIISQAAVTFSRTATATVDTSDDTIQFEVQPTGTNITAMAVRNHKKIMRGGDYFDDPVYKYIVNGDDWQRWDSAYGAKPGSINWNKNADGNGDNNINGDDWQIWDKNYGAKSGLP